MWLPHPVKHYQHRCSQGEHILFWLNTQRFLHYLNKHTQSHQQSATHTVENLLESIRGSVPQHCTWRKACADPTASAHAWLAQLGQPRPGDVPLALCHSRGWTEQPGSQTPDPTPCQRLAWHTLPHTEAETHVCSPARKKRQKYEETGTTEQRKPKIVEATGRTVLNLNVIPEGGLFFLHFCCLHAVMIHRYNKQMNILLPFHQCCVSCWRAPPPFFNPPLSPFCRSPESHHLQCWVTELIIQQMMDAQRCDHLLWFHSIHHVLNLPSLMPVLIHRNTSQSHSLLCFETWTRWVVAL